MRNLVFNYKENGSYKIAVYFPVYQNLPNAKKHDCTNYFTLESTEAAGCTLEDLSRKLKNLMRTLSLRRKHCCRRALLTIKSQLCYMDLNQVF